MIFMNERCLECVFDLSCDEKMKDDRMVLFEELLFDDFEERSNELGFDITIKCPKFEELGGYRDGREL